MSAPSQQQPASLSQLHPVNNSTHINHNHTSSGINSNGSHSVINANGSQAPALSNMLNGILLPPTGSKPISTSPPPQPIAPMDKSKPAQKAKDAATPAEGDPNAPKPKQVRKKRGFYKKTLLRMQAEAEAKERAAEIAKAEAEGRTVTEAGAASVASSSSTVVPPPSVPTSTSVLGIDSTVHPTALEIASSPITQRQQLQHQKLIQQKQLQQSQQSPLQQLQQQSLASSSTQLPPRHDSPSASSNDPGHQRHQSKAQGASPATTHRDRSGYSAAGQGSAGVFGTEEPKRTPSSKNREREHQSAREWDDWIQVKEEQPSQPLQHSPTFEQLTSRMVEKLGVKSSKHQNRQQQQQYQQRTQSSSHQRNPQLHPHQSQQHQYLHHNQTANSSHFPSTSRLHSQLKSHSHDHRQYQGDDDDEDAEDDAEETRADLEEELAMLAQEAADERKRQEQQEEKELERAQKTAQAVSLLRDLKSKLRGATELLGQNLQFQSGDMISQIFDEVLDDIGRDNLMMLNSLTDKRLKQQDDKYASILTSPEHADHIVTRSTVAAQLQGGERPTRHDLVSRRGRTKPHTVVRRVPDYHRNQSQHHQQRTSQMAMEESDAGDSGDQEDDYSNDQFIGQAWDVHADKELPATSISHRSLINGATRNSSAGPSKRNHSSTQRDEHNMVARPKKAPKTSSLATLTSSTYSSPAETLRMLSIAEDELRSRQKADFEALQRKHYGEFQELQRWMQKQHEEFQNVEFAKTRHLREQLERHPMSLLEQGSSNRDRQGLPLARQLTFGNHSSSFEYDEEGEASRHSPERSSPLRSPSPPPLPSARMQKKLRRDSSTPTSHSKHTLSTSSQQGSSSMAEFDQDRLIRASQQAGLARTPSSSSLKLTGVHHKLSKQMLKNRDGLPMSTMNLALTAMNEKRKLLKRASKLNMGTAQPVSEEHDDYDDDSDDSPILMQNGCQQASPSMTRVSTTAARGGGGASGGAYKPNDVLQARTDPMPKRATDTLAANMHSPFLVHNGSSLQSDSVQPPHARSTATHSVASPSPAPVSSPPASSRKLSASVAGKRRKSSSAGKSTHQKHEPLHVGSSSPNTNDAKSLNQALLNHYSQQWKSDAGTESLFDLMLSDPPEFDIDESEVESMLVPGGLGDLKGTGGGSDSNNSSKHKELNATPTSNAFKWYQKQQRLAEDLARQPKMAPLRLDGLTDDDSTAPTKLATPFDFASLVGQTGSNSSSNNSNSNMTLGVTGSASLFGESQSSTHFSLSNGLDVEHMGGHPASDVDPPSSVSLLPLDYMPSSSPISPSMDMLFSEDGHDHDVENGAMASDWGFKGLSSATGDLTDEFLHPESPGGGSHSFLEF
ncbi:hypothetical protein BGZ73_006261 [Actinomortierella ambigua]|nr:hypothetical protein BGZ73_006261 [Actinomortierella ambigua]